MAVEGLFADLAEPGSETREGLVDRVDADSARCVETQCRVMPSHNDFEPVAEADQRSPIHHIEIAFLGTTFGADSVFGHVGPAGSGSNAIIGPGACFVINVASV